uniref:Protein C10 n=1 Tax=Hucho hucho TaxID=62062 RepID=A0A4W5RQD2_9TELE
MDSAPAQQPTLTVEQARLVLSEVIQAFSVPENSARMEEARECACNMDKMLQLVLPMATQIQQEVIKAYGFNEGEGSHFVKPMYETQDPKIAAISVKLRHVPLLDSPPYGTSVCILHLKHPNKTYIKNITRQHSIHIFSKAVTLG